MRGLSYPLAFFLIVGCSSQPTEETPASAATIFTGARLIPGDGGPVIESSALVVEDGRIAAVGALGEVEAPDGAREIDLSGKTVMPLLVTLHTHPGYQRGSSFTAENYGRETYEEQLNRFLHYGVGAVLSLGVDRGELAFELREESNAGTLGGATLRTAGRGIAAPDGGPQFPALKPVPQFVETPDEARAAVTVLAEQAVDMIKIWVDDRNGRVTKLSPELYRAVIDEAHANDIRVMAHVYTLEDAKELARAGVDGFAHLVREPEVDDELVSLVVENDVFIVSNLNVQGHPEKDASLDDPALRETISADVVAEVRAASGGGGQNPERAQAIYGNMERSLEKLYNAGAHIAFGGDSGIPRNFVGFSEHRELALMVEAGMSPLDAIRAATATNAEILKLSDRGSLQPGKRADFMVLSANPLDNITNTRRIDDVYQNGEKVDR